MSEAPIGTTLVPHQQTPQEQKDLWEAFRNSEHGRDDERLAGFERDSERDPVTGRIRKGPTDDDTALYVSFSMERVFSKFATFQNGGEKTYVLKEFITIIPPGMEQELTRHSPVEDIDRWRFPREYERFKKGLNDGIEGTKLSEWKPLMYETALLQDFQRIGIHTVEQLSSTSDQEGRKAIRSFAQWKAQAKKHLDANVKSEATVNLEIKLGQTEAALKIMEDKLTRLMEQLASGGVTVQKKSGYKSKVIAPTETK